MKNNRRSEMSKKTDFNHWSLPMGFPDIIMCIKCKNKIYVQNVKMVSNCVYQICIYCGNPNYVTNIRHN